MFLAKKFQNKMLKLQYLLEWNDGMFLKTFHHSILKDTEVSFELNHPYQLPGLENSIVNIAI